MQTPQADKTVGLGWSSYGSSSFVTHPLTVQDGRLRRATGDDGAYPYSNLVFDGSGNLYGTA